MGVQIDIHKPHKGGRNWHARLLITTRRFASDGESLGGKALDIKSSDIIIFIN
ncbi:MAG: MobA/MobL family protein [Candidatus Midichloria mitochondrii]